MLLLLALLCHLCPGSGGTKLVFQVEAGAEECFYQAATANKSLVVEYQAEYSTTLQDVSGGFRLDLLVKGLRMISVCLWEIRLPMLVSL